LVKPKKTSSSLSGAAKNWKKVRVIKKQKSPREEYQKQGDCGHVIGGKLWGYHERIKTKVPT